MKNFKGGQRVVCVEGNTYFNEGQVYTVNNAFSCSCGVSFVSILETPATTNRFRCHSCMEIRVTDYYYTAMAKRFRPLQEKEVTLKVHELKLEPKKVIESQPIVAQ